MDYFVYKGYEQKSEIHKITRKIRNKVKVLSNSEFHPFKILAESRKFFIQDCLFRSNSCCTSKS